MWNDVCYLGKRIKETDDIGDLIEFMKMKFTVMKNQ